MSKQVYLKTRLVAHLKMSGKDFLKSHVLSWRRKMYFDWEDVASSGRALQVFGPATGKARLPTADRLTVGTRGQSVPVYRTKPEWNKGRNCSPDSNGQFLNRKHRHASFKVNE